MEEFTPVSLKKTLDEGGSVFLKLWKPGCGACKLSESATDRLEKSHADSLQFAKIDVSEFPEMLGISGSEVLPVFFVFRKGEMKSKVIGFKGIKKLTEAIEAE